MNMDTYQHAIKHTAAPLDREELVKLSLIGLSGELGEVCEPVKKYLYCAHELDLVHLEELTDYCRQKATLPCARLPDSVKFRSSQQGALRI
jgi:hypothetical protein